MSKIKILKTVRRNYAILGISPTHQSTQKYPFDGKVLFGFLLFGCTIILQLAYIFRVASGFMEYMECICENSGTIVMFIAFATIVLKLNLLFESIDDIENFMDSSEPFLVK